MKVLHLPNNCPLFFFGFGKSVGITKSMSLSQEIMGTGSIPVEVDG